LKRFVDIAVSAGVLLVASPLLALIGAGVLLDIGRPVLFRQERPGRDERPFILLKFRSMHDGEVSRFGAFLRTWSLDELPQLINVFRGDMSLVGPRPLLPEYLPYYSPRERRRHAVRPGLTGWAQIHGRNSLSWNERLEMDVWYVEHRSALLDARILAETIGVVLSRRGVVAKPEELALPRLDAEREQMMN
jgi:lipopolysaccharide/colanic/teichoic acid biosynthesis glycosyltransferase